MSSDLTWVRVVSPGDIAGALEVPRLTMTDTLHHHYAGERHEVHDVKENYVMYSLYEVEDFLVEFFKPKADDAALSRLYDKSIPIARKREK